MRDFNGIRIDGNTGTPPSNDQRLQMVNEFRLMMLRNPNAKIAFGVATDPEDLGLLQDIDPADFGKGPLAAPGVQEIFKTKGVLDNSYYYVGPDYQVRVRTGDLRTNPSPVAGIMSNLRSSPYWGDFNPLSYITEGFMSSEKPRL
jgi:hypothetical protein